MTGTNLDYANTLRLGRNPPAPRDEYLAETWEMIYDKADQRPETWRDRVARRIGERIIAAILRHPDFRRRLCLSLVAEMRLVNEWVDKPKIPPPAPHKD